jgi:hypothetical protein
MAEKDGSERKMTKDSEANRTISESEQDKLATNGDDKCQHRSSESNTKQKGDT